MFVPGNGDGSDNVIRLVFLGLGFIFCFLSKVNFLRFSRGYIYLLIFLAFFFIATFFYSPNVEILDLNPRASLLKLALWFLAYQSIQAKHPSAVYYGLFAAILVSIATGFLHI